MFVPNFAFVEISFLHSLPSISSDILPNGLPTGLQFVQPPPFFVLTTHLIIYGSILPKSDFPIISPSSYQFLLNKSNRLQNIFSAAPNLTTYPNRYFCNPLSYWSLHFHVPYPSLKHLTFPPFLQYFNIHYLTRLPRPCLWHRTTNPIL